MSRYRKVKVTIWGDAKFRSLSAAPPNGQTLFLYLITAPYGGTTWLPGVMVVGEAALAEQLGWPLKGFRERFTELFEKGLARADWSARLVYLPNAARHNQPDNPNVARAWGKAFDELPECDLKGEIFHDVKGFLEGLGKGFIEGFMKGFPEGFAERFGEYKEKEKVYISPPAAGLKISTPKRTNATDQAFAAFYDAYPRHTAPDRARRAYAAALKRATPDEIMTGLQRQLKELGTREPKFIPHPATWLNAGQWRDELASSEAKAAAPEDFVMRDEWLNACSQGEAGACVKTEFLDRVPNWARRQCPEHAAR